VDAAAFLGEPGLLLMSGATANGALPRGLPPIAILDTAPPAGAITDIATAARLLDRTDPDYLIVARSSPPTCPPLPGDLSLRLEPADSAPAMSRASPTAST
jgi:hypothetical protein